jgi:hypothetical protein
MRALRHALPGLPQHHGPGLRETLGYIAACIPLKVQMCQAACRFSTGRCCANG